MQSSNGGWAAFDVDNDAYWLYDVPVLRLRRRHRSAERRRHGARRSSCSPGEPGYEEAVARGVAYLLDEQQSDGSWFGRWGVNYVYGTGAALPALAAAGLRSPSIRRFARAVAWLEAHQNADGGFGEDCRSYDVGEEGAPWRGRGVSTPSQTAWALTGLVAAGAAQTQGGRGGRRLALRAPAGGRRLGRGALHGDRFPRDFLIRYHLYRIVWPMIALGRYREALR